VELESSNASLQKRLADLLRDMDDRAANFRSEMARKDAELRNKDEQIDSTVKDYKDLMEIKVALDMEIAVYRKLLEGEEARLGMSQHGSPEAGGTPQGGRGIKRKRTLIEEEDVVEVVSDHFGKGTIVIEPVQKDAKAIRVTNKSKEAVNMTGWSLSNVCDGADGNVFSYKFPRGATLAPDESCTVWSSDSQQEHNPPTNMVMKKGGWMIGSENKTVLVNKEGEEEACRTTREEHRQSSSFLSGSGTLRSGSQAGAADKSCRIM
jgi:lamin B